MNDNNLIDIEDKQKYFYSHKREDKYFFGSYFNLAYNNILEVIQEVNARYFNNRKIRSLNDFINIVFSDDISIVDFEKRIVIFSDYFPIISTLDKKFNKEKNVLKELPLKERIVNFKVSFLALVTAVTQLRNFYTHYYHKTIYIEEKVLDFLNNSLVRTALHIKNKYLKTDKTKEFLKQTLTEELDKLVEVYKEKNKKTKYFNVNNREAIINAIYNDAFRDFIYDKEKEAVIANNANAYFEKNTFKSTDPDFELNISEKGIVYLLSFFLRVKEIDSLKANLKGFKGKVDYESGNSIKYMSTQRIYSFHCYKGLKQRIKTSEQEVKETLLMQMIDELSKVPHVVYENVSEEVQYSFIEDWNEYYRDYENEVKSFNESLVIHPVIRKRYEDKFNYFALRFLDEFFNFPTLRFQIYLGDYIHDRRNKTIVNVQSDRIIKEKLTVFARLRDINYAKKVYFNELKKEDEIEGKGWQIFPNPSYDFPKEQTQQYQGKQNNAGKIGIYVELKAHQYKEKKALEDAKNAVITKNRALKKTGKIDIIQQIVELNNNTNNKNKKPLVYSGQPLAYLSMNDIHSILFALLTDNEKLRLTEQQIEDKIIYQIGKQVNQIIEKDTETKILKKYKDVKKQEINTSKLIKDLINDCEQIEQLIKENDQRLEDFNYSLKPKRNVAEKRKRKYLLLNNEKGKIGIWLSNDIKRFMQKDVKAKWKGYQHNELQKLFAYYESSKESLRTLLNEVKIVNSFPIELVAMVKSANNLYEFYTVYLRERKKYINNVIERVNNSINTPLFKIVKKECFVFLKQSNYLIYPLDNQVKRILAMPIFIERGFLDIKPTMIDRVKFDMNNKDKFADWFVYFKEYDRYQKFYDLGKLKIGANDNTLKQKVLKKITQQKKNDVYMLMMVNYMLKKVLRLSPDIRLHLEELYQTKNERLLNAQLAKDKQVNNLNFIWNKLVDLRLYDGKVDIKNVKLKDVGAFRKYENDSRVKTFITYQPTIVWKAYLSNKGEESKINVIERQLDIYERVRSKELLKEIQNIERFIYEKTDNKNILKKSGNENFKKYVIKGLLANEIVDTDLLLLSEDNKFTREEILQLDKVDKIEQDLYSLIYIRNKFAHNQLPIKEFFFFCQKAYREITGTEYYAEYYLNIVCDIRNKYINRN